MAAVAPPLRPDVAGFDVLSDRQLNGATQTLVASHMARVGSLSAPTSTSAQNGFSTHSSAKAQSAARQPGAVSPSYGDSSLVRAQQTFETTAPASPSDATWDLHEPVSQIDKRDVGTPDAWVPRHPELLRLTGRHPFNAEPPPSLLMEKGMVTPTSLHYVRNHGPTPKLSWETHKVVVKGLVPKPLVLSMEDIAAMPSQDVTCTLVCAGNRRKEQNMVKKSKGFNWGPAATGCSTWTGVRLSDLLRAAGLQWPPADDADDADEFHVCTNGVAGELPQGSNGSYGTSLPLSKVMNDANDIIVAYKQNGCLLMPDHGFPVRMIIPGHIGGRMVKWLSELVVTKVESDNFYHYHDNRVLPSHVNEAMAKDEGWWFRPDFIINELNINSIATSPAHEEVVPLTGPNPTYTLRGYAYTGGNKIIRCEASLDEGKSWRLADIQRHGKPNAYGKHWCWVHWSIKLPLVELLAAKEFCCRAWDAHMNTQPNTFTWNIMGMMNNCVYRVKINAVTRADSGGLALQFLHPVIAGPTVGGWMQPKEAGEEEKAPVAAAPVAAGGRQISMSEVAQHASEESCWFVRGGKVYDATPFLQEHPGGAQSIMLVAGEDATEEFDAIHSDKAKAMLAKYYIGELAADEPVTMPLPAVTGVAAINGITKVELFNGAAIQELVSLNPKKRIKLKLAEKEILSHNTRRFRFALETPEHRAGLPVGKHIFLYAKVKGELVVRAYTPTSSDGDLGFLDFVIKVYNADEHPQYPLGGKMSCHLETLAVGDEMEFKGPVGEFVYLGRGRCTHDKQPMEATHMSMIAGGTGITPCYAVLKAVLKDAKDTTQISLVYANTTEDDILLRAELDELAAAHDNLKVWYTVSNPSSEWPYSVGRITEQMMVEHLFPASPTALGLLCGPPGMIDSVGLPNLAKMGYERDHCIVF